MNESVYLGLAILIMSKRVMYELWYDFGMEPNYGEKAKLCYMLNYTTNNFVAYIKTEHIYVYIAKDVETRFYTSNYDRTWLKGKNKKVIWVKKDKLSEKIVPAFAALRAKTCSYLTNDNDGIKVAKDTKKCAVKRKRRLEDYKHCLEATQLEKKKK